MSGVNKVILLGHLGKDPELKQVGNDNQVCNATLATSEKYKDKETTEWHDLEIWGKQGANFAQYLSKGSPVFVEGKIKTDSWENEQGEKRSRKKILVLSFTMLGSGKGQDKKEQGNTPTQSGQPGPGDESNTLPF